MDISEIGKFALLDRLNSGFETKQQSTIKAFDDAAVVAAASNKTKQICSAVFLEGIHFNLVYTPMKHLGYKVVTYAVSKIVAMNAVPQQILVSAGVSSRFSVQDIESFYEGIRAACSEYSVDLVENNLTASLTGMTISVTAVGEASENSLCYRSGAKVHDLLCLSGSIGAAYMGLQVLERERRIFETNHVQPKLEGYDYVLQKQLRPQARLDMLKTFEEHGIKPSSMTDIADGLASDILHICKQSNAGVRIYLDKIPIAVETFAVCEEMNFDAVTAALNGGDDFELLFTLPVTDYETIKSLSDFEIIGYITDSSQGAYLVTPEGNELKIKAQGWTFVTE
ncbi:MAG: thiamine-phosphate kinase [Prevotellaceae bacterium]|jgi:thiamine-monophosphate kinase|nr:thiamine-phosphate kinase [Prevotellaceae bacterium]